MPLHPQAAAFLDRLTREGVRPDHELAVADVRARADVPPPPGAVEPVDQVENHELPGPAGALAVRVYTPAVPAGTVLYLHGGGHITGTVDSYDGLARRLANRVPATVVAVEYRRAPEHRCPAPVDDAEAAYTWILDHREALAPGSRGRVVVAGDSAGGNNAAVLVRRLRDGGAPPPALQVLIYPPVDAVAYRDVDAYPSYRENGSGYGLEYADGLYYWGHYLGTDRDPADPDASPLRAPDLAGLPPAYVLSVEYDVLRDENRAYADALRSAGVPVEHRHWAGHLHGFLGDPSTYDDAENALAEIAAVVRRHLMADTR